MVSTEPHLYFLMSVHRLAVQFYRPLDRHRIGTGDAQPNRTLGASDCVQKGGWTGGVASVYGSRRDPHVSIAWYLCLME